MEGVELSRNVGSEVELANGLTFRGFAALSQSDLARSVSDFVQALERCERLGMYRVGLGDPRRNRRRRSRNRSLEDAARILGFVQAAVESSGLVRIADETQVDLIVDRTKARLGAERFAALAREGAMLSYDTIVALARSIAEHVIERA